MTFKILIITPEGISEKFIEGYQFTIGRSSESDLIIPLNGVSRLHNLVYAKDADIFIQDLNSSFGTKINGQSLTKNKIVRYPQGSPIRLGKAPVVLSIRMITEIETAQMLAKENKSYINRLIKPDAVQDINAWLSSIIQPTSVLSAVAKRSLMNWEQEVQSQINNIIKDTQIITRNAIESAKKQGEQILHEANLVALDIQSKAQYDGTEYLNEINNKGLELINKSSEAAKKIEEEAKKRNELIIREAETKATNLIQDAKRNFEEINSKAQTVESNYIKSAEAKSNQIITTAKIEAEKTITEAKNYSDSLKTKTEQISQEIQLNAQKNAENIIRDAKQNSTKIQDEASKNAEELLAKYQKQATEIKIKSEKDYQAELNKAKEEAHKIIQNAENNKNEILRLAKDQSNKIIKEAEIEKEKLIELAHLSGEKIKKEYADQGAAIIKESHDEAERLICEANKKSESTIDLALKESEELRSQTQNERTRIIKEANINAENIIKEAKNINVRLLEENKKLEVISEENRITYERSKQKNDHEISSLKKELENLTKELETREKTIISRANQQAETIIKNAVDKTKYDTDIATAKIKKLVEEAEAEALKIKNNAKKESADIHQKATNFFNDKHKETNNSIEKILSSAKMNAAKIEEEAKNFYNKIKLQAEKDSENIIQKAKKSRDDMISKVKEIESHFESVQSKKISAAEDLQGLEQEIGKASARLEVLNEEYKKQIEIKQKQSDSVERKIQDQQMKLKEINSNIKKTDDEFLTLKQDRLNQLSKIDSELQSKNDLLKSTIDQKNQAEKDIFDIEEKIKLIKQANADLLTKIKEQEAEILSRANNEASKILQEANASADLIRKKTEHDSQEKLKAYEQELMARRLQANEDLKNLLSEKEKEFDQNRKMEIREILHELQEGVLPLINQIPSLDEANQKLIFSQIRKTVKSILNGESVEHQNKVKSLLSFNPQHADNTRKYYYKVGTGVAATIILASSYLIAPKLYAKLGYKLLSIITPEGQLQEMMAQEHFERLRKMRHYNPKTDDIFKSTFTDNILYTTNYSDSVNNSKYKEKWTLALNEFFLKTLNLHETTVAKYMGVESKTLMVLEDLRSSLNATNEETLNSGLNKMREEELEKTNEIKDLLGGDKNFEKFWSFHKQHFENHKIVIRNLASDKDGKSATVKDEPKNKKTGQDLEDTDVYTLDD